MGEFDDCRGYLSSIRCRMCEPVPASRRRQRESAAYRNGNDVAAVGRTRGEKRTLRRVTLGFVRGDPAPVRLIVSLSPVMLASSCVEFERIAGQCDTTADFDRVESHIPPSPPGLSRRHGSDCRNTRCAKSALLTAHSPWTKSAGNFSSWPALSPWSRPRCCREARGRRLRRYL